LNHVGVYAQSGTTKFFSCGLASTVLSHVGGSTIARKDLFLTGIKDVHFSSSTNGTLLAGNSTLRKMNTNQQWKTIKPDAASAAILSSQYTKVWSVSAAKSLVVGINTGAMIQNETASISTSLPTNVVALAANQNNYYFAKANAVVGMTISSNGSLGTPTTYNYTGQQINSIDVLDNNDFAVAGENGFFAYRGVSSGSIFTASIQNADINDLKFVDHVYAVAVGDNGAY
jgi:hypothetical protein